MDPMTYGARAWAFVAAIFVAASLAFLYLIEAGIVVLFPRDIREPPGAPPAGPAAPYGSDTVIISPVPVLPPELGADHTIESNSYALRVEDQPAADIVEFASVRTPIDAWIVVYAADADGRPGPIIGTAFFPGLKSEQSGGAEVTERLRPGHAYFAAIHGNTDELSFDPETDPLMKTTGGTALMVRFWAN